MGSLRLRITLVFVLLTASLLVVDQAGSLVLDVVVLAALTAILSLALIPILFRPLDLIGAAAARIAGGDLAARVRPRPAGEIGELSDAFNRMAVQVQEQIAATSQERSRLIAALNSSVDAVAALDGEARVLFANAAFERLFGRDASAIVGRPFVWALPDDRVLQAIHSSRRSGVQETSVELLGRRHLQVITAPIEGGGDWEVLVLCHDLTEVRRTEQVRRDFVANVSHELRTPLASIKSVVETLSAGAISDQEVAADFLVRADAEVDRLVQMVEELLELSRIESGELPLNRRPADVGLLVTGAAERLWPQAERKQQTLTIEVSPEIGSAELDAARLERAVINLLQNAIKFTPDGGRISLTAEISDGRLVVRVTDTGDGIAREDLSRIFERFYKADHSRASVGSGLGLALVKHAVEAHGGAVSVESQLGHGSCFTLSIPLSAQSASSGEA